MQKIIIAKIITTEKDYVKMTEFENNLIKPIEIDLEIENNIELINFLKSKLYEKHKIFFQFLIIMIYFQFIELLD